MSIVYENSFAKLEVTPDTAQSPSNIFYQTAEVTNKMDSEQIINVGFLFPEELIDGWIIELVNTSGTRNVINGSYTVEEDCPSNSSCRINNSYSTYTTETYYYDKSVDRTNYVTHYPIEPVAYGIDSDNTEAYVFSNIIFGANEVRRFRWSYKIDAETGKWDLYAWQGGLDSPSKSWLLDPWWNNTWNNKLNITIQGQSSKAATNYSYKLAFNTTALDNPYGITEGEIRFTFWNSSDSTEWEIPHYTEKWNTTGDSIVYINLPSLPASGSEVYVYMYYSNTTTVSNNSNFADTFTTDLKALFSFNDEGDTKEERGVHDQNFTNTIYVHNSSANLEEFYGHYEFPTLSYAISSGTGDMKDIENVTIVARIYPTQNVSTYYRYVMDAYEYSGQAKGYRMEYGTGATISFKILNGSGYSSGTINLPLNEWKTVIGTHKLANTTIYADGFAQSTANNYMIDTNGNVPFAIGDGSIGFGSERNFTGSIAEVRMYDQVLNEGFIWNLMYDESYSIGSAEASNDVTPSIHGFVEATQTDFTADGTNYGRTSKGFTNGTNTSISFDVINTSSDILMAVMYSKVDGALVFHINNISIGCSIPTTVGGDGTWNTKICNFSNTILTGAETVNIEADEGNTDPVYLDYIAWLDVDNNISDNVLGDAEFGAYLGNYSVTGDTFNTVWFNIANETAAYSSTNLPNGSTSFVALYNYSNTVNFIGFFDAPANNQNFTFEFVINGSVSENTTSTNYTINIDSTSPVINTVTTDINAQTIVNLSFDTNISEFNFDYTELSIDGTVANITRDSAISFVNNQSIYNYTINYTVNNTHTLIINHFDKAGHNTTYSFTVKSSELNHTYSFKNFNTSYDRTTNCLAVADAAQVVDEVFKVNTTINSFGDAYIDDYNISTYRGTTYGTNYLINDTLPHDHILQYDNGTMITLMPDYNTTVTWIAEPINNTANNTLTLTNYQYYTINGAIEYEWENAGVSNQRIIYLRFNNLSDITGLGNIWLNLSVRTAYAGGTQRTVLKECTGTWTWKGNDCSQWGTRTSNLYDSADTTYHDGTNYPTVDTDGDGLKDLLFLKIPVSDYNGTSGIMYQIDLETIDEANWTGGDGSGGTGGTGGSSGNNNDLTALPSSIGATNTGTGFFSNLKTFFTNWIINPATKAIDGITGLFTTGLSFGDSFLILTILMVLILAFLFLSGKNKKSKSDSLGFEI